MLASTWAMIPKTNKQTNKLAKTEYDTKAYKEDKQFIFKIPDRIKRFEPVKYWLVRKASREWLEKNQVSKLLFGQILHRILVILAQ